VTVDFGGRVKNLCKEKPDILGAYGAEHYSRGHQL
jgi:hypothetical protein